MNTRVLCMATWIVAGLAGQAAAIPDAGRLVVFAEPGFPVVDVAAELVDVPGAVLARNTAELCAALTPDRVLVWRHGSTFPASAWEDLLRFLEGGGSMIHLGGQPFTRMVGGTEGDRHIAPPSMSQLKTLRLNQCRQLAAGGARLSHGGEPTDRVLPPDCRVSILEPRLSDTRDSAHEDGAPGARDAALHALSHIHIQGENPRFPAAAGSWTLARLRGRFAGGQWVFWLLSTPPTPAELELLLVNALRPATELRVDPAYGCYHEGEQPALLLRLHRPTATAVSDTEVEMEIHGPGGRSWKRRATLRGGSHCSLRLPLRLTITPGLYRVQATTAEVPDVETGFWVFDPELFTSGDTLTVDGNMLYRDGRPEPVVGTTVMSATVHRKFLFEPNAAVWDDTFRELSALDINLVRTGVWSAYRKISLDPHVIDEAWLRSLEAYYLSARKHNIAVMFTFFSFVPESFGGVNPYLDPRAIEGQRAYLSTVATRFAEAREIIWDLINEPSFSSPDKLWRCRPHGDAFEERAFEDWLRGRYGEGDHMLDTVRSRWRLTPDQALGLPADLDFEDAQVVGDRKPYRAREYLHFAQDAFAGWIQQMSAALRDAGSTAMITVGQDEGGLAERPNPLFFHRNVDFTSMHTWWFNDALWWDGLLAKAPGRPLVISETGVMNRERLSGTAHRDPLEAAALLSRKIGYAFAARACGVIQWCYEINPYMASDNEVAIGLKRPDGSYTPEHRVLREFAAFIRRNTHLFSGQQDPQVAMVLPSADHFGPRNLQQRGTRLVLDTLSRQLNCAVQVVSEYRTAQDLGDPRLIVLPSTRGLSDAAWEDIRAAVQRGAVLHCSGWFETDDANLPAQRLGVAARPLAAYEPLTRPDGQADALSYGLDVTQSWVTSDRAGMPTRTSLGRGTVLHYAQPIDWAFGHLLHREYYRDSLTVAGVAPPTIASASPQPGIQVMSTSFEAVTLVIIVNETSVPVSVSLVANRRGGRQAVGDVRVDAGYCRMALVNRAGKIVDRSGPRK